jgi:hypothetical protein
MKRHSIFALVAALLAGQIFAQAGSLRKIWEVDLRKRLEKADVDRELGFWLYGLSFSPDSRQLAAVVGGGRLLVIQLQNPNATAKQYMPYQLVPGMKRVGLGWSPDAQILYSRYAGPQQALIHVTDSTTCVLKSAKGFNNIDNFFISNDLTISKGLRISRDPFQGWAAPDSHFTFFDTGCQEQDRWDVPENWNILDMSVDRGLLSIMRYDSKGRPTESLISDPFGRKVLHRWPWDKGPRGLFADSGKAICAGGNAAKGENAPVTCWDVDTGEKIGDAPTAIWGRPIATAARAGRLVIDETPPRKISLSDEYEYVLTRRLVWDFRSGQELVSWRPEFQSAKQGEYAIKEPFSAAISPDGQYIAEGGNGIIRLYKIEP